MDDRMAVTPAPRGVGTIYFHDVKKLTKGSIYYCISATNGKGTSMLSAELKAETALKSDSHIPKAPIITAQGSTAASYFTGEIVLAVTQGAFVHSTVR
jgi:hypothetical protein